MGSGGEIISVNSVQLRTKEAVEREREGERYNVHCK